MEAVSDLMAVHGAGVMWSAAYPTTDGVIPWALFWALYQDLPRRYAFARMQMTTAVLLGAAQLFGSEAARQFADNDIRTALP